MLGDAVLWLDDAVLWLGDAVLWLVVTYGLNSLVLDCFLFLLLYGSCLVMNCSSMIE